MLCARCGKELTAGECTACGFNHVVEEVLYLSISEHRIPQPVRPERQQEDTSVFDITDGVLTKYRGNAAYVSVPYGVSVIGHQAFSENRTLKGVLLPPGVQKIDTWAFWNCRNLESVVLPVDFDTIGAGAFENCFALKNITFPSTVENIELYAFQNCRSLTELDLSHCRLKQVGVRAFAGCDALRRVHLRFAEGGETDTYSIENCAFAKCKQLEHVILRGGLNYLASHSFLECTGLKTVEVHCMPSVHFSAFEGSSDSFELITSGFYREKYGVDHFGITNTYRQEVVRRKRIALGEATMNIADYEFGENDRLVRYHGEEGHIRFPYSTKIVGSNVLGYGKNVYGVSMSYGVEEVEQSAFKAQQTLIYAELPNSVQRMGKSVFWGCTNLEKVKLPMGLEVLPEQTFEDCHNLYYVTLPEKLKRIESNAFRDCAGLQEIHLPKGLEVIGASAFANCTDLKEITIPDSVREIAWNSFRNCFQLNTVHASDAWKRSHPELMNRILKHDP